MKFILSLLCLFLLNSANSQINSKPSAYNFGTLRASDPRYTDFFLTNTGAEKIYILWTDAEKDVTFLISSRQVLPDSTAVIRVQFNPKEKGRFSREINVFVSSLNEPLRFTITGEVAELPASAELACPDFNAAPRQLTPEFVLELDVVDNITGEPVRNAEVKIVQHGLVRYKLETTFSGHLSKKIPLGYYYFVISAEGYHTNEKDQYVNSRNNTLTVFLDPVIRNEYDPEPDDSLLYVSQLPPHPDPGKPDTASVIIPEKKETPVPENPGPLPEYKFNNLVFLVDISGSMLFDGKLELLKTSMVELAKTLRPEDHVSLVVFASRAVVLLDNVSGLEKDKIIKGIEELDGGGNTSGSEGMKEAYRMAEKNKIAGGNNMVIMATDGAFNIYTSDVIPIVRKYRKKEVFTSVIGIKNSDIDAKTLKTIAETGNGKYLSILKYEEAVVRLTEEIHRASRIH